MPFIWNNFKISRTRGFIRKSYASTLWSLFIVFMWVYLGSCSWSKYVYTRGFNKQGE